MINSLKRISKHLKYEQLQAESAARSMSLCSLITEADTLANKLARVVIGLQSMERWFEQSGTEDDTVTTQINVREALNRVRETLVIIGEGE